MLFSGHSMLSRVLNYPTLFVAGVIILCINFWNLGGDRLHFTHDSPTTNGVPAAHDAPTASDVPVTHESTVPVIHNPPEPTKNDIPKKIWYKLGPHGISDEIRGWTESCTRLNPDYEVVYMTDDSGDEYVRHAFASRPDIVDTYLRLTVPIFKADILRYVLLYEEGGIWSDLDISCEGVPIDQWIPEEHKRRADLVVGWEFDFGWPEPYIRQFTTWTIMARAKSPHLMQVINDIFEALHQKLEEKNVSVENATLSIVGDVVDFSGPRRFTRAVYTSLGKQLNKEVGENDLSHILQPKLLGDVLVLPARSFAASSNTYTAEESESLPPPLVTHHYAGTWKNDHGGED